MKKNVIKYAYSYTKEISRIEVAKVRNVFITWKEYVELYQLPFSIVRVGFLLAFIYVYQR